MKVLIVHNQYQFRGGEETVVEMERKLLTDHGHEVIDFIRNNDEINEFPFLKKASLLWRASWSDESYKKALEICEKRKPDVAHFHNTRPLITPSAYYACRDSGVPVVQTLHNYRLICPAGQFLRDGSVCEKCPESGLLNGVYHRCYRQSAIQTLAIVIMLYRHRRMGTWKNVIDRYISPSGFLRKKLVENGFDGEKVSVKPNFVSGVEKSDKSEDYALFFGRLSVEKGVLPLIEAWKKIDNFKLKIVGDGPQREALKAAAEGCANIEFTGGLPHDKAVKQLRNCRFVILPSVWYENFPMTIVESFACGKPVLVSRLGAPAEIVEHGKTGFHCQPGDGADIAVKAKTLIDNKDLAVTMGNNARKTFEDKYGPEENYRLLMQVYEKAIGDSRK